MARVLIVGGSDRGRRLAAALTADGLQVRMTTRDDTGLEAIAAAGAEPVLADPDRIGTLMDSLAGVTVLCWMMGVPEEGADAAGALHGDRLRMLFEKLVDTPVRGVVYEAAGTLPDAVYAQGREIAAHAAATWALPVATLDADPRAADSWLTEARACVTEMLTTPQPHGR